MNENVTGQNIILIISGCIAHINSAATIAKYKLGSPGNISTIKAALESKEIIDFYENKPEFVNPLFEYWFKNVLQKLRR